MRMFKVFLFVCFAVSVALVCSGFQKTEEHTISHVYRNMDGDINYIAKYYYKFSDKEVVGTLDDYQMLVRVYNRDKYNPSRPKLQPGDILTIPVRRLKK